MMEIQMLKPDTFSGAVQKFRWANRHIAKTDRLLRDLREVSGAVSAESDGSRPDAVAMSIDYAPFLRVLPELRMRAGDAIHNLRSALDHLAYGIVAEFQKPSPYLYFPMDAELNSLKHQASFREIKQVAPDIADLIVNVIKPYGAGNLFVKLNHLDRANKHRFLLVHKASSEVRVYMAATDDDIPAEAERCFILLANPTRVPTPGSKASIHNEHYSKSEFDILFDQGLPFENEPVMPALRSLSDLVSDVISILANHGRPDDDKIAL
jgi:hypothetical protein